MNIFVLDTDPVLAAQCQVDKHVVKMTLETTQLLSTAHWLNGSVGPYKATHRHHPCTIWTAASLVNYNWLARHGVALLDEYTARYGKQHACSGHIHRMLASPPKLIPRDVGLTPFAIAMNKDAFGHCIVPGDPVASYRNYYRAAKADIATWKRNKPSWWVE